MSRRSSATMNSSRPRTSVEDNRKHRHSSRTHSEVISSFPSHLLSGMMQQDFPLVPGSSDFYSDVSACWPMMNDPYFSGNDSAHIPTLSVDPTDLTHQPYWDATTRYENGSSSSSSGCGSDSSISPPMIEAQLLPNEPYHATGSYYEPYPDQWIPGVVSSPSHEDSLYDPLELFDTGKNDSMAFQPILEDATECEYLGPSKLQFSSAPSRHSQPRPIRSASERTPTNIPSGSPQSRLAKDDHVERVKNNPRNDPRYEEKADKDGYFHCPYATEGCNHKPTKQKCIYAKNLDSHLKPYACKYGNVDENCKNLRFSSNACLFRHEREMHGMHNHGINPYLCQYPGCERARRDNGFPRRWNQRDHMKRVHGFEDVDGEETVDRGYPDSGPRRKKSATTSHHVPMKRTSSSRAQANYYPGASRNISAPRYVAQATRELQARNILIPGMNAEGMSYHPQQIMMNQPYVNYLQAVY